MARGIALLRTAALGALMALAALPARATEVLQDSQAPYWEAGPRDPKLSNACSLGRFNQRQVGRYIVRLHAKAGGAAVLGAAKGTGLNLWDPDHLAVKTEDYMFRRDGTSACEVFVGGRKPPVPPGQTPPGQQPGNTPGAAPGTSPPPPPPPQQAVPGASPKNGPPT